MKWGLAVALSVSALTQTLNPSPRAIVAATRALTQAEIAAVLAASRQAVAGKAFRLSYVPGGMGPELVMRADGRPRFERTVSGGTMTSGWSASSSSTGTVSGTEERRVDLTTLTHFTGETARSCGGAMLSGELVVEYRNEGNGWTATARLPTPFEFAAPLFDMLAGALAVESGATKDIGGQTARGLVAPWKPPAGAIGSTMPPNTMQTLWIDVASLLPVRYGIAIPAMPERGTPAIPDYGLSFTYDPAIDLSPPDGVTPPSCVR